MMKKKLIGIISVLLVFSLITTATAISFNNKQDAENYRDKIRSKGTVEIIKIVEILDERMEVHYKFDYKVDGNVISTETAMVEIDVVDLKVKAGTDAVKAAVEKSSQQYFDQVKSNENIEIEYDDMKGMKYDGSKWLGG